MRPTVLELIARTSRSLVGVDAVPQPDDSDLLARVVSGRDEAAFAAVLERHGRLVWGVCRGVLGDADAEDAFQATFVALFRGAATVRRTRSLAPWLHATAHRIANKARRAEVRRIRREQRAARPESAPAVTTDETWDAIHHAVHDEIARLPEALRTAFVLCVLEGRRHAAAAAELGVPVGTLSARVSRAKAKLLDRLRSRGVAPALAATAAACGGAGPLAAVPEPILILARRHLTDGFATIPTTVHRLAASAGGGTSMVLKSLAAVLVVGALAAFAGGLWSAGAQEKQPAPAAPPAPRAGAVDLAKVDRGITKEPKYKTQPFYALLAVGPKAEERAWLVVDGDDLYVDRNGNGDLTEEGERVPRDPTLIEVAPGMYKGMASFPLGEVHGVRVRVDYWVRDTAFVPATLFDKQTRCDHEEFGWESATLWRVAPGGENVSAQTPLTFCRRPKDAQVCHLGGPVTPILYEESLSRVRDADHHWLTVYLGTPGLPPANGSGPVFAPVGTSEVPADAHPVAHFAFPHKDAGKPPIPLKVVLDQRYCGDRFYGPVRVPADAAGDKAQVTVSFPAWKEGQVAPATFEVRFGEKAPEVRARGWRPEPVRRGAVAPDWLPLGTVRTGTIVEASFAVYGPIDDPKKARVRVDAPPFVQVVDKSVIEREFYDGDKRIKGAAGIVVVRIDTGKPGVLQGQIKVELEVPGAPKDFVPVSAKVPVSVVVKRPEPGAVKVLVVESPFHWTSTGDPTAFKDWTDLAADAGWDVSYLVAINGQPLFRDLDLSKFDVILLEAGGLATEGNAEALKQARTFAAAGGRLVLTASHFMSGSVAAANTVLDGYGLKMLDEEGPIGPKRRVEPVILGKESFAPEVVKAGITSARFHRASPVVVSADKPARVLVKAVDVGGPKDGYAAVAKAGKGAVVALGTPLWWDWVSESGAKGTDNAKLLRLLLVPAAKKN